MDRLGQGHCWLSVLLDPMHEAQKAGVGGKDMGKGKQQRIFGQKW